MKVENAGEDKATGPCTNDCDRVSHIALLYAVSMVALIAAIAWWGYQTVAFRRRWPNHRKWVVDVYSTSCAVLLQAGCRFSRLLEDYID
jgi:hypothetical protein